MLVCAIIFSVARNQNCSCSYVSIENHVFGTILGYFSKPLETGKLPNLPSEIRVKLEFWHAFHFFNPSSLTCSQPGARTQSIVLMPVCMPVCAIVFSAVRNQNCFFHSVRLKTMYLEQFWDTFQNPSKQENCQTSLLKSE